MNPSPLLSAAAALLLSTPSLASGPVQGLDREADRDGEARAVGIAQGHDRHATVLFDVDASGTHWARGRSYKASADASGFAFVPFFGSDAPKNYPVRFRLTRIERGGHALELDPTAGATRDGDRIRIDRGGAVVRYDLTPEAVEQSFALDVPDGSGDLVMSLDVETELAAQRDGDGFRFSNSLGSVSYGAATVFDADGRSAHVPARWTGDGIDLTVPATFLESASTPIVVDPLIAAFPIDTFMADLRRSDAAYDMVDDKYLVVYEEIFSGGDTDIYSIFVDGVTGSTTGGQYIDSSSDPWERPCVAQNRHSRKFLIVAENISSFVVNRFDLVGRFRHASGTAEPQFVLKAATLSYSCIRPDIGSEGANFANSYFCIVYNREFTTDRDAWAIVFDNDGNYVGNEIPLATSASRDELRPSVSKSTGTASGSTRYIIAWLVQDLPSNESWVEACQLGFNGSAIYGPFQVTTPTSVGLQWDVTVSSLSTRRHPVTNDQYYVIATDRASPSSLNVQVALCSGTTVHSVERLDLLEHRHHSPDRDGIAVATTPEHFLVGFVQESRVRMTTLQPVVDDLGITERRTLAVGSNADGYSIESATPYEGGIDFPDGLFVWTQLTGSDTDIWGSIGRAITGQNAAGSQYCFGTSNSTGDRGFILAIGDRTTVNPMQLRAEGMPQNALGIFIASLQDGWGPNAGGGQGTICIGGSIGRFGVFNTSSTGRSQVTVFPGAIAQPTGTVSASSGQTWHFQAWHRDAVGGTATSNFTNAVAVTYL